MKPGSSAISFASGIIFTLLIISQLSFNDKKEALQQESEKNPVEHNWFAPVIPSKMDFAGEPVPLHRWEIKEQFDREYLFNYYMPANVLFLLKLANRYFPMIEQQLKQNGIPEDFKYLCVAESNMTNATSRAGAVGFWQFMKGTSPGYGLTVNDNIDERYHVVKSTNAACKYLKRAYEKFGSWTAAAASYNCGMGGFETQANFQGTKNYYDLVLPEETQRYIFRILAFKQLLTNADELGFTLTNDQLYSPVTSKAVTITSTIPNLAEYARQNGTTYKMLRLLNPWLRSRSLVVKNGNSFTIQLPVN